MKKGKKYRKLLEGYDKSAQLGVSDAIAQVKKNAAAKFDETIEVHIRTGCDGRHAEQQVRGAVVLPHGTGKSVRVLVFAKGDKADEAEKAGADFVAPYVNRLDNIIGDGCAVISDITAQFRKYSLPCKVLAASFKNAQQVYECAAAGCDCVTVSADVLKAVITHPMTDAAISGFDKDWKTVYGEKTILDF